MDDAGQNAPTNLFLNLLKNEDFRARFVNVYCDYANEVLTPEKANAMAAVYSRDYTEQLANTTVRRWGFFGGSKDSNISYNREQYKNNTLPQIATFFRERKKYTLEHMRHWLNLSFSMNTITLKTSGGGKIRINSITPDTSGGWSGEYSEDCPVTLTALPDEGHKFTGWSGSISGMTITANFAEKETVRGDVNADGDFNIADVVLLQNWLLGRKNAKLADWQAADLFEDGKLNVFDLCLIKKELFK